VGGHIRRVGDPRNRIRFACVFRAVFFWFFAMYPSELLVAFKSFFRHVTRKVEIFVCKQTKNQSPPFNNDPCGPLLVISLQSHPGKTVNQDLKRAVCVVLHHLHPQIPNYTKTSFTTLNSLHLSLSFLHLFPFITSSFTHTHITWLSNESIKNSLTLEGYRVPATPPPDPECLRFPLFFNPRIEMLELCLSFCFDEYMLTL
jgi:hypothetical protein